MEYLYDNRTANTLFAPSLWTINGENANKDWLQWRPSHLFRSNCKHTNIVFCRNGNSLWKILDKRRFLAVFATIAIQTPSQIWIQYKEFSLFLTQFRFSWIVHLCLTFSFSCWFFEMRAKSVRMRTNSADDVLRIGPSVNRAQNSKYCVSGSSFV